MAFGILGFVLLWFRQQVLGVWHMVHPCLKSSIENESVNLGVERASLSGKPLIACIGP